MTAHQRRPGFPIPWSAETETGDAGSTAAAPKSAEAAAEPGAPEVDGTAEAGASASEETSAQVTGPTADADTAKTTTHPAPEAQMPATSAQPTATADEATPATGFLGDLVAAMRRVAEEARDSTLADLRSRVDLAITGREADAERRRNELRGKAEADIAGVGDWAQAEAERIKADAEQRVAARRAELEHQLAAVTSQVESAADGLRSRIAAYERELERYHEQLAATTDPAAFAAAAKRMPPPPALDGSAPAPAPEPAAAATAPETFAEPVATEIVVKGLGSFGAITGFRQQLANVEGPGGTLGGTASTVRSSPPSTAPENAEPWAESPPRSERAKVAREPAGSAR
ncbi:MAG: hypothetical protein LC744_08155 [Chloroflexi bacterium]|nr:hypothetical protein [Chloroflexota bacterium]